MYASHDGMHCKIIISCDCMHCKITISYLEKDPQQNIILNSQCRIPSYHVCMPLYRRVILFIVNGDHNLPKETYNKVINRNITNSGHN